MPPLFYALQNVLLFALCAFFPMIPFAECMTAVHEVSKEKSSKTVQKRKLFSRRAFAEILPKFVGSKFGYFANTVSVKTFR